MTSPSARRLASVKDFEELVNYLADELRWPVESEDFDEATFEYDPEELGIDSANAAKIAEIKQLRPLSGGQPFGVFFVKFEPHRLPVVALRRILSQLALKKRVSAAAAERAMWAVDDLLFVSTYGESETRHIDFAHFSEADSEAHLPTLKVLGWDNLDTPRHMDYVAEVLSQRLSWPADEDDTAAWREMWKSAFVLRPFETIRTSRELSTRLAELARAIRASINAAISIETSKGSLTQLMRAFQESLLHDLDADGFADMYAQTIAYGLLSSRITDPNSRSTSDLAAHMRTNPFLSELMGTFLQMGEKPDHAGAQRIDFDELGVGDVVRLLDAANMDAVLADFDDRNPQEDPVIHFYEGFAKEYDPIDRVRRGEFYTPRPVVTYIVRRIHELLVSELHLPDGLADTSTWGEVRERLGIPLPEGASPSDVFVQILDPATGTGTFLVEVIDLIHQTLVKRWTSEGQSSRQIDNLWNEYVTRHLLTRLHAYELKMAPYAIAHLKVGLKLHETGYRFETDERARIYLTNALESPSERKQQALDGLAPALAHEARAVSRVKSEVHFTVVLGNPPYAKNSANRSADAEALVSRYKAHVRGERNVQPLSDDYLKFMGMSQEILTSSRAGVHGMITNRGWLSGLLHRGVRQTLLEDFTLLEVLDLHGDSNVGEVAPDGRANENVFDIQQGVAILVAAKSSDQDQRLVTTLDAWGTRAEKYKQLLSPHSQDTVRAACVPSGPQYFFLPQEDARGRAELSIRLTDVMPTTNTGMKTHRDALVIDFDDEVLLARIRKFADPASSDEDTRAAFFGEEARGQYLPGDNRDWSMVRARQLLRAKGVDVEAIRQLEYRPFDKRYVYYDAALIDFPREDLMAHMELKGNLGLITTRQVPNGTFCHAFVTRNAVEMKTCSHDRGTNLFPLKLARSAGELDLGGSPWNVSETFLMRLETEVRPGSGNRRLDPTDVFAYIYSLLWSPTYRLRHAATLRADYPPIMLPRTVELLSALADIGSELIACHLLEAPGLQDAPVSYVGIRNLPVGRVRWVDGSVWVDAPAGSGSGLSGFAGVSEDAWMLKIGGYQVCEKWLKDRKGRPLTDSDITHYIRVVSAVTQTITLMKKVDHVIENHGGWPDAFVVQRSG